LLRAFGDCDRISRQARGGGRQGRRQPLLNRSAAASIEVRFHVLILCTHNSARSVLAEGMLNHWAARLGKDVQAHSAGSAPSGRVNPLALAVLKEAGVDTAGFRSKSWDEFSGAGAPPLSLVITVCDNAAAETCPVFMSPAGDARVQPLRAHWGYPDPSSVEGGEAGRRRAFELTRQAIGYRLLQLLALPLHTLSREGLAAELAAIARS
jgi:arsenate reductase